MDHRNFTPFPDLETERLQLRQLRASDEAAIFSLHSDKENRKYLDLPLAESLEDAQKFIKKISEGVLMDEFIYWGICLKNKPEVIGTICIWNFSSKIAKAEVGFELGAEFQRQGYMTEALHAIIHYGFKTLNLSILEAYTNSKNPKSSAILKKFNFEKISVFNEEHSSKKYYYSMSIYKLRSGQQLMPSTS